SPANRNPLYVLSFTYPTEIAVVDQAAATPPDGPTPLELAAASDPYAVVDPAELNFIWDKAGSAKLLPAQVYDDGQATFLTWPGGVTMPAILTKDHEGTEGPVNFAVRGDVIVIDGVPHELVLRAGDDSALLTNRGPVRP